MKHSSIWTVTLAAATAMATGAWAQHGGTPHGGGGHDGPPQFASTGAAHSGPKNSSAGSSATPNFESRLANSPALSSRLQSLLPAGTSLASAASGFKSEGQFIAALHVSHNLNIPFSQLKTEMTGTDHDSLGKAIHELRPGLGPTNVKNNIRLAENQTKTDLEDSGEPTGK